MIYAICIDRLSINTVKGHAKKKRTWNNDEVGKGNQPKFKEKHFVF